jgi:hypothetical protein
VCPLRRVHRQALLAAPNNGHSLFQEPPYAVRAELWWGPSLKDACPYFCGFSCNSGCNIAFEFDDPTGHWKCKGTFTCSYFACACFAGAALVLAEVLAWVRSRFRSTARSPCRRDDSLFPALLADQPYMSSYAVKTLTGRAVVVGVSPDDLIAEVKGAIADVEGVTVDQQRLFCGGLLLQDGRNLNDYNVSRVSSIYLVVSRRGGGKKQHPPSEPGHEAETGVPSGAGHEEGVLQDDVLTVVDTDEGLVGGDCGPVVLLPVHSLPSDYDIDFGPASSGWHSMTSTQRAIYYGRSGCKSNVKLTIAPCDAEREPKPASSVNSCVDAVSDSLHQDKGVSARNSRKHGLMPPYGTRSRRRRVTMRRSSSPAESVAGVGLKSPQVHGDSVSNCAVLKAADALCANLREARENRKTAPVSETTDGTGVSLS